MLVLDVNSLPTHAKEYSDNKHIIRRDDLKVSLVSVRRGSCIPAHVHEDQEQFYYVLRGGGTLRLGEQEHVLEPGVAVLVPLGTRHAVANPNDVPLEYLDVLMTGRRTEAENV